MFDAEEEVWPEVVGRAALAPSPWNSQPWRWVRDGSSVVLEADWSRHLPGIDPGGEGLLGACGAAMEATLLALSALRLQGKVTRLSGVRDGKVQPLARIELGPGAEDPLQRQLEARATWCGPFDPRQPRLFGWTRGDMVLLTDQGRRDWIGALHEAALLRHLRDPRVRVDRRTWARLSPRHPRQGLDGMGREALGLSGRGALALRWLWGPAFPLLDRLGLAQRGLSEAHLTATAPLIAVIHRPRDEDPVETGRAWLRCLLEAASLGFAAWPMEALPADPAATAEIAERLSLGEDRRLVAVVRLGHPRGTVGPRARRPLAEVLT